MVPHLNPTGYPDIKGSTIAPANSDEPYIQKCVRIGEIPPHELGHAQKMRLFKTRSHTSKR